MPRQFSGKSAKQIRDEQQCSMQEAVKLAGVTSLLDDLDAAASFDDFKNVLSRFITMQTGIS